MTFDSKTFFDALFSFAYVKGAFISLSLATCCQILAIAIGFALALARTGNHKFASAAAGLYIWFFRAIPALLLLMLFWFSLPEMLPLFRKGWYSPFLAALLAFAVLEAAYMAEILRASLMSVDDGQATAARALGMQPKQSMRHVVLPQMIRIAIPPTANEYIGMIKYTSLASIISLQELLNIAGNGVNKTFRYSEYYSAAALYYLLIVSVLMYFQRRLERKYSWTSATRKELTRALK